MKLTMVLLATMLNFTNVNSDKDKKVYNKIKTQLTENKITIKQAQLKWLMYKKCGTLQPHYHITNVDAGSYYVVEFH